MFKFLFGKKGTRAVVETQRETVSRCVDDLNSVLALMADKPKIGIDLNSGLVTVELPEQMPDEALALPAPVEKTETDEATKSAAAEATAAETTDEKAAA